MKHLSTILAVVALSALAAIGCGKKSDSTNATAPLNCSQGQLYSSQYNSCLVQNNQCQAGYGWYSGTNTCVSGTPYNGQYGVNNGYGQNYWIGSLVINDRQAYQDLLRMSGMCSRYDINFGSEKCKHYSRGGRVQLQVSGNIVQISITSLNNSSSYNYPGSVYNGWIPQQPVYPGAAPAAYAPLTFTGTLGTDGGSYLAFQGYSGLSGRFSSTVLQRNMNVELFFNGYTLGNANLVSPGY